MALVDRVKQLRNEHGWSQGELADQIGADPAQISRYENGRITPPTAVPLTPKMASATASPGSSSSTTTNSSSASSTPSSQTRLKALAGGIS